MLCHVIGDYQVALVVTNYNFSGHPFDQNKYSKGYVTNKYTYKPNKDHQESFSLTQLI